MLIAVAFALVGQKASDSPTAGSPVLTSPNDYRILSESITVDVDRQGPVEINTLAVYRNMGGVTSARITIPFAIPSHDTSSVHLDATWDHRPIVFKWVAGPGDKTFAIVNVPLGNQGTHALRIKTETSLNHVGYGNDEYETAYRLEGSHPVEQFTMAYRYPTHLVFGQPEAEPALGWEIGPKGASIRKENFTPNFARTSIRFFMNTMKPLGQN